MTVYILDEFENNDADTDRGILRNRCVVLVFQNGKLSISEEDFESLIAKANSEIKNNQDKSDGGSKT
jgi:hypothetical protein